MCIFYIHFIIKHKKVFAQSHIYTCTHILPAWCFKLLSHISTDNCSRHSQGYMQKYDDRQN